MGKVEDGEMGVDQANLKIGLTPNSDPGGKRDLEENLGKIPKALKTQFHFISHFQPKRLAML